MSKHTVIMRFEVTVFFGLYDAADWLRPHLTKHIELDGPGAGEPLGYGPYIGTDDGGELC